jgi:cytochrome c oxidase subunit III
MATTHDALTTEKPPVSRERAGDSGDGWNNGVTTGAPLRSVRDYSPPPSSSAIWVLIAAIVMSFAAFSSALIVRQGASLDWRHTPLPPILYLNTLVLLLSSVALAIAKLRFTSVRPDARLFGDAALWLYAASALGVFFLAGQCVAWMQLRSQGIYLATNPSSSFFYVLTVAHAVHILGGLCGFVYVLHKLRRRRLQKSALDVLSRYWHFVDLLWVYLLFLLLLEI